MSKNSTPLFGLLLLLLITASTAAASIASVDYDVASSSSASRFDDSRDSKHFVIDARDVLADPRAAFLSWADHYSRPAVVDDIKGKTSLPTQQKGGCHGRAGRGREGPGGSVGVVGERDLESFVRERSRFDAWASNVLPRARRAVDAGQRKSSPAAPALFEINGIADVPISTLRAGLLPAASSRDASVDGGGTGDSDYGSGFDAVAEGIMDWLRFPYAADAVLDALLTRSSRASPASPRPSSATSGGGDASPLLLKRHRPRKPLPASVDWSKLGVLGPVKNQHINNTPCGCCWSFATTGVVEGVVGVVGSSGGRGKKPPPSLSEQQLIDCDRGPPFDDLGCQGGSVEGGVHYIVQNHGRIDTEEDYPYTGVDGDGIAACRRGKERKRSALDGTGARVVGFRNVPSKSESALKAAVARHPVAVAVCCGDFIDDWHAYTGGIMTFNGSIAGCPKPLDHAVVVVGYGSGAPDPSDPTGLRTVDYWIVKNSWGDSWGEDGGYFKLARGLSSEEFPKGAAGVLSMPNFPVVERIDGDRDGDGVERGEG